MKPTVAIAGASGFIGLWFMEKYRDKYSFIGLSRRKYDPDFSPAHIEWRQVDLFSLSQTTEALNGADYAIYLVHSMQPSTRMNQSTFDNTDILLADNFARAASANAIKQIIFLGGILPDTDQPYSRHLRSRYEVERTLSLGSAPLTSLRAGIIVGPGGSSFSIMEKLVRKLPIMVCPSWTRSISQPIALMDVLKMLDQCLGHRPFFNNVFDIGGPEKLSYIELMQQVGTLLGLQRWITTVPFFSPRMSKLWVSTFGDTSPTLVSPLVESLKYDLLVRDNPLMKQNPDLVTFKEAAQNALFAKDSIPVRPKKLLDPQNKPEKNTVRSVQRLPNPYNRSATWVARRYQTWLPRFFRYLLKVDHQQDTSTFRIGSVELLQFRFVEDRSDDNRQLFYIIGGKLVKRRDYGWLEFRRVLDGKYIIAAIHEFVPTLPWFIYVVTQAVMHLIVMHQFGKHLENLPPEDLA